MKCNGKKFRSNGQATGSFGESTENELDDMRQIGRRKINRKQLNERIGQSFEIVRSQLENVQKDWER